MKKDKNRSEMVVTDNKRRILIFLVLLFSSGARYQLLYSILILLKIDNENKCLHRHMIL